MKIFAIESSAKSASAALIDGGVLLGEFYIHTQLTHSETLMPMAEALLQNTRVPLEQVDVFTVSAGPGSFTGIRIGVAAVKGMAMAASKPCAAVSTLEAIGENYRGQEALVCAVMDARCNQVYNALFDCESGEVTRLCQDRALSIEDLFTELAETPAYREKKIVFAGDGARLCFDRLQGRLEARLAPELLRYQKASNVAFAALRKAENGLLLTASELMPVYLRLPQATRELNKRKGASQQ